jgi:hypothetical protein
LRHAFTAISATPPRDSKPSIADPGYDGRETRGSRRYLHRIIVELLCGNLDRRSNAFCVSLGYAERAGIAPRMSVAQMNERVVHVFLGHPPVDPTERSFLQRLRRDLEQRGIPALILANLEVGSSHRQLDFVVVSSARTVHCELKGYREPVIGRANGVWEQVLPDGKRRPLDGNPYRQARDGTYALSDELRSLARRRGDMPAGPQGKFYKGIDTVVCLYPEVPQGSRLAGHPYVTVLGYAALLERLATPGPHLSWSGEHWGAFIRHLGLSRLTSQSAVERARRAQSVILEDYRRRFLATHAAGLRPRVPTGVLVDGRAGEQPDTASLLIGGQVLMIVGPSGVGKTFLARHTAVELARQGHIPIWLRGPSYDDAFDIDIFLGRATAPFTTEAPRELLHAAAENGCAVAIVLDELNGCQPKLQTTLLHEVGALRLQTGTSVVITSQSAPTPPEALSGRRLDLLLPDRSERAAILRAYEVQAVASRIDAFTTPFELQIAAECAADLGAIATRAELFDAYIRRQTRSEAVRAALRYIAACMHAELRGSLLVQDVIRALQRDVGVAPQVLDSALACPLVVVRQGLIAFTHEYLRRFLAAEALVLDAPDGAALARSLSEPRHSELRRDALALEREPERLSVAVASLTDSDLMYAAVAGDLGESARRVIEACLEELLDEAVAVMVAGGVECSLRSERTGDYWAARWSTARAWSLAERARLATVGRSLHIDRFIERVAALLSRTDSACSSQLPEFKGPDKDDATSALVASVYALARTDEPNCLPVSLILNTCATHRFDHQQLPASSSTAAKRMFTATGAGSLGGLYATTMLIDARRPDDARLVARVLESGLTSRGYHLMLSATRMAEDAAEHLHGETRAQTVEAIERLVNEGRYGSALIEVLAAYELLPGGPPVAVIEEEIRAVLELADGEESRRSARSIVTLQSEDARIVGPYTEAIDNLDRNERARLLLMAARCSPADGIETDWILGDLARTDLANPAVRDLFISFLRTADPSTWHGAQLGISSCIQALRACARFCTEPPFHPEGSRELCAWMVIAQLCFWIERKQLGADVPAKVRDALWSELLGDLRAAAGAVFHKLKSAEMGVRTRIHEQLVHEYPRELCDLLQWSIAHRGQLTTCFHSHDEVERDRYFLDTLGRVGNAATAALLRDYANDAVLAEPAARAIRAIELRADRAA